MTPRPDPQTSPMSIARPRYLLQIQAHHQYFIRFTDNLKALVDECADATILPDGRTVLGIKFPLAVVTEALQQSTQHVNDHALHDLVTGLRDTLWKDYLRSSFHYFDKAVLPADLDTMSILTRLFRDVPMVRSDYSRVITRNRLSNGLVRTWLDASDYSAPAGGRDACHIDVLLNWWLTETQLHRSVSPQLLAQTLDTLAIRNYWYIPPLFTPFLYARLLRSARLTEPSILERLKIHLTAWSANSLEYIATQNADRDPRVKRLAETYPPSHPLDLTLAQAMAAVVGDPGTINLMASYDRQDVSWRIPIYWTRGYRSYTSEAVARAIGLLALTTILEIGGGNDGH
jgi:hypothetical protein